MDKTGRKNTGPCLFFTHWLLIHTGGKIALKNTPVYQVLRREKGRFAGPRK
jgi:hypothetical protein